MSYLEDRIKDYTDQIIWIIGKEVKGIEDPTKRVGRINDLKERACEFINQAEVKES